MKAGWIVPAGAILLAGWLVACAAPRATYDVLVPAETDVGDVERLAVADFDGLETSGQMVAAEIAERIVATNYFQLYERSKLQEILDEREFSRSDNVDPATANELKLLGIDALIFGTVDLYSVDDQTGITKVTTKVGTGEYETVKEKGKDGKVREVKKEVMKTVLIDRGYVIREGTMGVTFRMANVNTGRVVAIKTETVNFSERAWRDERNKLPTKDMVLESLSSLVVDRFLAQIQPRTMRRVVEFEKNDDPQTSVGIKYAQAGLWDKAELALRETSVRNGADASAHYNYATICSVLGMHETAIVEIERAIALEPKDEYIESLAMIRQNAEEALVLEGQIEERGGATHSQ